MAEVDFRSSAGYQFAWRGIRPTVTRSVAFQSDAERWLDEIRRLRGRMRNAVADTRDKQEAHKQLVSDAGVYVALPARKLRMVFHTIAEFCERSKLVTALTVVASKMEHLADNSS